MANLLASIFGGGSQQAPTMPTYNMGQAESQYQGQNFAGEQSISNNLTANTSQANLSTFLGGLGQVDSGAITGINAEQHLGNNLLTGGTSALPSWAQNYLNQGQRQGSESAVGRGVGAFSGNGLSGVNQYEGNNALTLLGLGKSFADSASSQANGIVNSNMYRNDPNNQIFSPSMFQQAGEFNTGILGQNAVNATAAQNYNNNNSPLGSAIRTGLTDLTYLAGSFLGGAGKGMALA